MDLLDVHNRKESMEYEKGNFTKRNISGVSEEIMDEKEREEFLVKVIIIPDSEIDGIARNML